MTTSRTKKTSGAPGIIAPHYFKTEISGGGKTRSGVGKTSEQSQKNAQKNFDKTKKK